MKMIPNTYRKYPDFKSEFQIIKNRLLYPLTFSNRSENPFIPKRESCISTPRNENKNRILNDQSHRDLNEQQFQLVQKNKICPKPNPFQSLSTRP